MGSSTAQKLTRLSMDNDDDSSHPHESRVDIDTADAALQEYEKKWLEKGNISLWITFVFMVIGLIVVFDDSNPKLGQYLMSFGLFGFAGGFTNWLAVTMLFVRIPGLIGSGVIPVRYVQIRETVKDVIMATFFDPEFLEEYLGSKLKQYGENVDTQSQVKGMVESPEFDQKLDSKLKDLGGIPEFAPIMAMGMDPTSLKPMIKPFVADLGMDLAPLLKAKMMDPKVVVDINEVRDQIELYM